MKYVHTADMVAHLWANQSQESARVAHGNFYFEGDTIYSYGSHFPIAKIVKHKGKSVVLFTTRGYSPTTSKHIWTVRSACRHLTTVDVHNPRNSLKENLAYFEKQFQEAMIKVAGARKGRSTEKRVGIAAGILEQRNALAVFMGRKARAMPADTTKAAQNEAARRVKAVKAEKKKRQLERFERLDRALAFYGCRDFEAIPDAWRAGQQAPGRYEYETLSSINAERKGLPDCSNPWPCMLRVNPSNPAELETSLGVTVPLDHAHRIYKVWARVQGKVPPQGWTPKSQADSVVGSFKVDSIEADGTLHAGCHTIASAEVKRFGQAQGW